MNDDIENSPNETETPAAPRRARRWLHVGGAAVGGFVLGLLVAAGGGNSADEPGPDAGGQADAREGVTAGDTPWASGADASHDGPGTAEDTGASEPVDGHEDAEGHEHGPAPDGWREAAEGFGQTFTQTSLGQDAWYTAVASWMTPAQAEQYAQVPVEHIPTGELVDVEVADPGGALFTAGRLTYDTGLVLEVGLTYDATSAGWLVATVAPAANQ